MELYIVQYEEEYACGLQKVKLGVGAYCNKAKQFALNYQDHCLAQKRIANFIATPLDQCTDIHSVDVFQGIELLIAIQQQLGEPTYSLAKRILDGETLSKQELSQLRKSNLHKLLLV